MTATEGLLAAVDRAFEAIDHRTVGWADPHPSRTPRDEEYSRLTNPARWRILGDRADAWSTALRRTGLASVRSDVAVRWEVAPRTDVTRTDVVVPLVAGALQMVVARSGLGGVDHAGLTIGVGDPAVVAGSLPECGCDACDSGSADALGSLDDLMVAIVSGTFRRLSSAGCEITVVDRGWSASGTSCPSRPADIERVIAHPVGWTEVSGAPWFDA